MNWKGNGLDMSTVPDYKPPMESDHRMYVRNTLIVAVFAALIILGLVTMGIFMARYSAQTSQHRAQVYKAEYQKAMQACERAAPSDVAVCVSNVNQNFQTGG